MSFVSAEIFRVHSTRSTTCLPIAIALAMAIAFSLSGVGLAQDAPKNPFLADSPWPIVHHDCYQQGSSSSRGVERDDCLTVDYLKSMPVAICLVFSGPDAHGKRVAWGNTLTDVFKIDANGKRWHYADQQKRMQTVADGLSGAYSLIDRDNIFYVPHNDRLQAYGNACPGDNLSAIRKLGEFILPAESKQCSAEKIVGLNMTYDGWLAIVTDAGGVGVVSRDFSSHHFVRLRPGEEVSNTLAVDEDGGLYVVSSRALYRVQWDGASLGVKWRVPYMTTGIKQTGRLGLGSGTTPTLMGFGDQDKLVVIADDQRLMHLLAVWRDKVPDDWQPDPRTHPRLAAAEPIQFGNPNADSTVTDQSVLVSGYSAAVVSNKYGELRWPRQQGLLKDRLTILFSNRPNIVPMGVEKFTWNVDTRRLERNWSSRCLSCPNAVPTMSRASGKMYFVGARSGRWTLEAVDWLTGESSFHVPFSKRLRYNSYYAATEVGLDGQIVTGMFGGLMRVSSN